MSHKSVFRTTIFLYFTFYSLTSVSAAIECYQCSTATTPECAELSKNGIDTCKTTAASDINCVMYMFKLNGKNFTYRGCRQKSDTCDDVKASLEAENKEFVDCALCDTDLCKAASTTFSINLALILLFISFPVILK